MRNAKCEGWACLKNRVLAGVLRLAVLAATQAYAQTTGPQFPDPGNAHMSRENQRALGLQAAAQVYQQMPVLPDSSPETKYIRQLGEKLVVTIPAQNSWPFEFHVVAQKEINAFALPGGPMFVNIGTITAAANEAQLAGVMAHEMSHVYMQHSAKQASKAETTGLLAGLAGAVLGEAVGGTIAQLGEMGIQMTAQGMMLKYSRSDEAQADAVGAVIMYKAGYNPRALAEFFKTLETQGGPTPPQWLSDHPNPGNREEAIEKEIQNWPPEKYAGDSAAFQKTKQQAMGVKAYTGEEIAQGAKSGQWASLNKQNGAPFNAGSGGASSVNASVPAGTASAAAHATTVALEKVLPSERMVTEELGPMKIERPENWQVVMPQKQGNFVTIAPQAGMTASGVGYGLVLNGVAPRSGERMDIDEVTKQLVQEMQKNNGLQPVGEIEQVMVGDVPGRSVNLQSTSPFLDGKGQAQKERDWMVTVPARDGSVIFFVFVAPQAEFGRFQRTYEAMIKSVKLQ